MTIWKKSLWIACLAIFPLFVAAHDVDPESPIGVWLAHDSKDAQHKSHIRIYERDGKLWGDVVDIIPPEKKEELCVKCKGENHNKPILGMTILMGFEKTDDDTWGNGEVLDPKNGKVYKATLQIVDQGHQLEVRGYVGSKKFGRTNTWYRIE